nr:probable 2-oxoglutarate-dependent dioxygenase AOP1 [Tanacetum cinerariifolium]
MAKKSKGKEAEPTGDVTLRWSLDEEALLAECYVAVSEDRNVGRSQANDTCQRLKKSGENEVDLVGRARVMYQDESRNSPFNHDKAWAILRQHAKWDAPEVAPVDLTEDETRDFHATVNTRRAIRCRSKTSPPPANNAPEKNSNPTHRRAPGEVNRPNSEAPFCDDYIRLRLKFLKPFKSMVAPGIYSWTFTRYFENSPLLPLYESVGIDDAYNPEQVENFTNLMWNSNHICLPKGCFYVYDLDATHSIAGDAAANDFDIFFAGKI